MSKFRYILFSLFIPVLLAGQQNDSSSRYNLTVSSFNDSWGGGFTRIKDDYRSFGLNATFDKPGSFSVQCQYSGLTDKALLTKNKAMRLDELFLTGTCLIKQDFFKYTSLYGIAGLYVLNDLGGEQLQDKTHSTFGVGQVKLPYPPFRLTTFQLGACIQSRKWLLSGNGTCGLYLQPLLESFIVADYFATVRPQAAIQLISTRGALFSITPGYQYSTLIADNTLLRSVIQSETGPTIEYQLKAGILFMKWKLFPGSNYSAGSYGLNILLSRKKAPYTAGDLMVELGNTGAGNGYYSKYLWNKTRVLPEHLAFAASHQFGSYLAKNLGDYPKLFGHYRQTGVGAEYCPVNSASRFPVQPYAGIQLGLKQEFVYAGTSYVKSATALSAFALGEAGIRLLIPGRLLYENTRWGLSFNYKYLLSISRTNAAYFSGKLHLPASAGYYSAGVFMNLDL